MARLVAPPTAWRLTKTEFGYDGGGRGNESGHANLERRAHLKERERCRTMKIHGNTLYVQTNGAYLHKDGETVKVDVEH